MSFAQEEEQPRKGFDKENLFFGGNFGLSFGDYTLVNISPQVGYRFSDFFAAGAGVNFIYSSFKYRYNDPSFDYRDNYGVAGLNIFGRVYPIQYILLQVQPEMNYTWGKRKFNNGAQPLKLDGKMVPSLLLGAGASIPIGGRRSSAMTFMLQYDVIQNERSPYGKKAFFNVGFNF
jgi:hypothetical protein